ncbi:MAG: PLP-dependent aminotransferase family protein [Verrucomicrobia bacterium]|nr:PLP-dependent aminotransferase family protein [Verrucomicrobiota bacterium]
MKKSNILSGLGRRTAEPAISWLMRAALEHPHLISLAAGFTDNKSLPVAETRALLNDLLRSPRTGQAALQYGTTLGAPALRRLTAQHLQQLDGGCGKPKAYSPGRLIITSGSQQLLYMVTEALCDAGDIVLVEDPTYFVYLGILQSHGIRARGVRLERDGLDLAHLKTVLQRLRRNGELRRVKLLYLVSYYQNPTGVTTSFAKKRAALALLKKYERAAGHPIYLLEDTAYRELRFAGEDVKSTLAAKGFSERVILAGTYSKPFATGVRVGFSFLPEPVFMAVTRIKGNHDFGTSNLLQQLLARALASGHYDRHLHLLRKRYARKALVMRRALVTHFPKAVEWREPAGGLYFWARLPRRLPSGAKSKLFQTALAHDVLYVPGELCYADDPARRKPDHEMRLSFGSASETEIRAGIARLGTVLRKLIPSSKL